MLPVLPKSYGRYVELFAGSASLFFRLAPGRAILSDNNIQLMSFYRTVRFRPAAVYKQFASIPRDRETYYAVRQSYEFLPDAVMRAACFFYLNRNCFNGIYRTNLRGAFNVPFSDERVPPYPTEEEVEHAAKALRRASLECVDFCEAGKRNAESGDFVYLDPPYYRPRKRVFREYSSRPFAAEDIARLQRLLRVLDKRKAKFLLSYPACPMSERLAKEWQHTAISVRRTVAGNVGFRGNARELLIFNYSPANEQ